MKLFVEKEVIMTHLDDEAVLLNIKNGRYFKLNNTAERLWTLLQEHGDSEKACSTMMGEYDVDKGLLCKDIEQIISQLTAAELVILP